MIHVQFYFQSSANFRALSGLPTPARRRFNSPIIFISLRQTQKKLFCLLFKLILIFCFTFTTCELCLYFLNWVFQLKVSSKLSTYARKQMATSRSGNADREKPTFKDFQCQVGDRNVNDAEANRNKYCAIIPNPKRNPCVRGRDFDCSQST